MKILAIGKNYALHNKEMDGALYKTAEPVVFMKPDSALLKDGKPFFLPDHLGRVDHEVEVVVRITMVHTRIRAVRPTTATGSLSSTGSRVLE